MLKRLFCEFLNTTTGAPLASMRVQVFEHGTNIPARLYSSAGMALKNNLGATDSKGLFETYVVDDRRTYDISVQDPVTYYEYTRVSAEVETNNETPAVPTTESSGRVLTIADLGKVIKYIGAGSGTYTIPSGLASGFNCVIVQMSTGQVTVAAGSGVTLNSQDSKFKSSGQYASVGILNTDTDEYVLAGATVA
jgi:hypothetical protein